MSGHDQLRQKVRQITQDVKRLRTLSPADIYFTHDSISYKFKDHADTGYTIYRTYEGLATGTIPLNAIPNIYVKHDGEKWRTVTGNRRLWVFRRLHEDGLLDEVNVIESNETISKRKMTTKNGGVSVLVRAPGPSGLDSVMTRLTEVFEDLTLQLDQLSANKLWVSLRDRSLKNVMIDDFRSDIDEGHLETCISLGRDSYILISDDNEWCAENIPLEMEHRLESRAAHHPPLEWAALGPNGEYCMRFRNGCLQFDNVSDACADALMLPKKTVARIGFGPGFSWWIEYSDFTLRHYGLPTDLVRTLIASNADIKRLNIGGDDTNVFWFILWKIGTWEIRPEAPNDVAKRLVQIKREGGEVCNVEFGSIGNWVIHYASQ